MGKDAHQLAVGVDQVGVDAVVHRITGPGRHVAKPRGILRRHPAQFLRAPGQGHDVLAEVADVGIENLGGVPLRIQADKNGLDLTPSFGRQPGHQLPVLQQFGRAHVRTVGEAEIDQHRLAAQRLQRNGFPLRGVEREVSPEGRPCPSGGRKQTQGKPARQCAQDHLVSAFKIASARALRDSPAAIPDGRRTHRMPAPAASRTRGGRRWRALRRCRR